MIIEGEDGVTHINIYSKAKTEFGRWLSNFTQVELVLDEGTFQSIEGYWYYLSTKDERFKTLYGWTAKKLGKEITSEKINVPEQVFREKIKKALDIKIKTESKWITNSELPFCHYYEYAGKKIDAGYEWIVEHIERRRRDCKEHKRKKYSIN